MAALLLFTVNIILILGVWGLLRRSIQDRYRDRFFDMRDSLRTFFLENGYGLDRKEYCALRNLLNCYLRTTHKMQFSGYMAFLLGISDRPNLRKALERDSSAMFASPDEAIRAKIREVRNAAAMTMFEYMIVSSPMLIAAVIAYGILLFLRHCAWTLPGEIIRSAMRLRQPVDSVTVVEDFSLAGGADFAPA